MYDPFAQPPAPGTVRTMTAAPAAMPSGVMPLSPNNALAAIPGGGGGPMRDINGGGGGGGFGGRIGRMMNGLQLPAGMTAQDFLTQLQGLDWHSLNQGYHGDVQDWRQGGRTGDRPTMQDQFASYFGGTYGAPASAPLASPMPMPPTPLPVDPVMTPGGGGTGAPLQGPTGQFPLNPGAGSGSGVGPGSNDWRTMRTPKPSYGI